MKTTNEPNFEEAYKNIAIVCFVLFLMIAMYSEKQKNDNNKLELENRNLWIEHTAMCKDLESCGKDVILLSNEINK